MPKRALANTSGSVEQISFKCIGPCKKTFTRQRGNFPTVQSALYAGNNYYLPWCNKCVDAFYTRYRDECDLSEDEAIKRLCSKFDIYWSKAIHDAMPSSVSATQSRMRTYIGRTNLTQYAGRTYDDTIAEEAAAVLSDSEPDNSVTEKEDIDVPQELIEFWGRGKESSAYGDLQRRYEKLTKGCTVDSPATEMLVKQACLSEYEIDLLQREGKPFEKQQSSLVNTLGSLNLKPSQIKEAEKNSGLDTMPLGVGAQHWEMTRPIGEADPSWKDVDGIIQYIMTWYTGASMEMFDVDSEYSDMFRKAIDEYTVNKPDIDSESEADAVSFILSGGKSNAK